MFLHHKQAEPVFIISNPCSFSMELSTECTKQLILFLFELEEVNNRAALRYLNATYSLLKSAQRPQIKFSHRSHLYLKYMKYINENQFKD